MSDEGEKELKSGRYVLARRLGEGSQGETWEAIDRGEARKPSLNEQWNKYVDEQGKKGGRKASAPSTRGEQVVAIKAFRIGKAKEWKDVELAEREARTLQSLRHPNLPRYIEHFEEDGALYLVMEKIEGESLASIRKSGRALAPREVERLLEDLAKALDYLHGHAPPVVHRDIKPGNVIRRPDGSFALVDFGAVRDRLKPSGGSTVVGTFGYMAPEQFQGRASPKSDVYGAAATALAMLTGEEPEDLPHEGLALDVRKAAPSSTPKALLRALEGMLEPDPDRRAGSIAEALAEEREARERKSNRKQRRRDEKKQPREERREEKLSERQVEPAPILARVFARLGLLVALVAVWLAVGMVAPLVLVFLSLFFGQRLRNAAGACVRAAKRAQGAIGRASARLGGRIIEPPEKLRVAAEANRVRVAESDAWLEEKLEGEHRRQEEHERRRAQMKRHAQRKHWGR